MKLSVPVILAVCLSMPLPNKNRNIGAPVVQTNQNIAVANRGRAGALPPGSQAPNLELLRQQARQAQLAAAGPATQIYKTTPGNSSPLGSRSTEQKVGVKMTGYVGPTRYQAEDQDFGYYEQDFEEYEPEYQDYEPEYQGYYEQEYEPVMEQYYEESEY
jgi:hypothetical protein